MVTFDFAGKSKAEKGKRRDSFIKAVSDSIRLIPTLGDPRTILMPVESVWGAKYPEPGMIRLSAGFEDYEELESTIKNALQGIYSLCTAIPICRCSHHLNYLQFTGSIPCSDKIIIASAEMFVPEESS